MHEQTKMSVETYTVNASSYNMHLERRVENSVGYTHQIPGTLTLKAGENAVISVDEDKGDMLEGTSCKFG